VKHVSRLGLCVAMSAVLLCLCSSALSAQPADKPAPTLQAKLILKTDMYNLDPAQSGPEFVKKLEESEKETYKTPPPPPAVDMTLQLTNVSRDPVTILLGGDFTRLDLKLEGPGAVRIAYVKFHAPESRDGKPTSIEPGKSVAILVTRLTFGERGDSFACYWTAPGAYTCTAYYTTFLLKGGTLFTFAAAPVKVNVLAPAPVPTTAPAAVTREKAIEAAAALLKQKGLDWGQPDKAQQLLNGGWKLQYATPEEERRLLGPRTLLLSREGVASIAPRPVGH